MATAVNVSATNNSDIDGLLSGYKWSGTITYSFPDAASDYASPYSGGSSEPTTSGFASAPSQMQTAINYAIGLILGYTNANIQYAGTNGADIMVAQSPAANPTSYAYYPGNYAAGGDVWFGTAYNYSQAALGNYYFTTALHELGHALGLKHSQEAGGPANVAVPSAHDDSEYTVMSYRSYVGASTTSGYTNEAYGYSQTYMANDILALQTMYGANFSTHSENTVYSWSPTTGQEFINGAAQLAPGNGIGGSADRIFETIWDGNGIDTYDLSNYATAVTINLNPGASSITSTTQLAYLGNGHYAQGNIFNAYLYNGDARSYIDNANGGSGNDTLIGNAIANVLKGGRGTDTLTGGGGADTFVFALSDSPAASGQHDRITDFTSGTDKIDLHGIDAISSTAGYDLFHFIGLSAFDGSAGELNYSYNSSLGVTTLQGDTNGDRLADFAIDLTGNIAISTSDLIGVAVVPVVIESLGATTLTLLGSNYYLYANGTSSGPSLKTSGVNFVAGQFGNWLPISAEQTTGGYEVAWKVTGADMYSIWTTDSSGNFISSTAGLPGADYALQTAESNFSQDLNGDGHIGLTTTVIEANGSTHLTEGANHFFLYDSAGLGPSLRTSGADFVAGQFGNWLPISAEQTTGGYEVAWKVTGSDMYSIWTTDSSGNFISSTAVLSGADYALQSAEPSFFQDLNGDGHIGLTTTVIETNGSTHLTGAGNHFFLYDSAGSGPSLKVSGADFVAGQFGSWLPISAERTASGYEVVWKVTGSDMYSIWTTDSGGNFISSTVALSGADYALQSAEPSSFQDLNGDGHIGLTATMIASSNANEAMSNNVYLGDANSKLMIGTAGRDTFVFSPNFGQDTIAKIEPGADIIQFTHTVFADVASIVSHTAEDGHENAVIQNMTTATLQLHLSDFHIL
ncbi:M10 family metallopeptidase C-terminal domain-containing protein [Bradyrhizobium sp. WSM1253]|uniref:M10 family metallopeptidase C-terminal domain-containing protein n=1 Tax=Bradyrhizobium sp. WSM1253 TaxID=319003 RepID=UPI00025D2658|nr:M10 family metallopeptidase C-terminal domain-containing protein [Bradyrhizobium sp. WSM1253]EIG62321.1 matrixin [Bradyrhizobium sp. WSM1253]